MNYEPSKIEKRIAALMAKADSTDSEHEAHALYAKAEQLMLQHAIDRSRVEGLNLNGASVTDPVTAVMFRFTGVKRNWKSLGMFGSGEIVKAIGLTKMAVSNRNQVIWLYGRQADIDHTRTILESVWRQAQRHLAQWRKVSSEYVYARSAGRTRYANAALDSYLYGFCTGAASKIRESKREFEESEPGAELVLANLSEAIDQKMGKLRNSRSKMGLSENAKAAGYSAGYRATYSQEISA